MARRLQELRSVTDALNSSILLIKDNRSGALEDRQITAQDLLKDTIKRGEVNTYPSLPAPNQMVRMVDTDGNITGNTPALPPVSGKFLTDLDLAVATANNTTRGLVKLLSSISSSSGDGGGYAATPLAVKTVNDAKVERGGDTISGILNFTRTSKPITFTTAGVERGFIEADTYGVRLRNRGQSGTGTPVTVTLRNDGALVVDSSNVTFNANHVVNGSASWTGTATGNGTGITNLNASNLSVGAIPLARLTLAAVNAGNGLSGGGNLGAIRTISMGTPSTLTVSTGNGVTATSHTHNIDLSGRSIGSGDGLSGGGNLGANRTLSVDSTVARRNSSNTFTGTIEIKSTGNSGMEMGRTDGVSNTPFIDFHSSGNNIDYDSRIIANGGNGTIGQGSLSYFAKGGHTFTGFVETTENFRGSGRGLTSLNATQLSTGSVPRARLGNGSISAGNGLTGGGTLNNALTITLGTPSTITDASTNSVTGTSHSHAIDHATTSVRGIVQLVNSVSSTSTTTAATPNSVKSAYDRGTSAINTANTKLPISGGTVTGQLFTTSNLGVGKYLYLGDYDDALRANGTGLRTYVRDGSWYIEPNTGETNQIRIRLNGQYWGDGAYITNLSAGNIATGVVPRVRLPGATTTLQGAVKLYDADDSPSTTMAPTANALRILSSAAARTSVNLTAGNGLSGGGNLTTDRTFTLGTPSTVSASSGNTVGATTHSHSLDLNSLPFIGRNQVWRELTSSRSAGVTYTNTTGRPIQVNIRVGTLSSTTVNGVLEVQGVPVGQFNVDVSGATLSANGVATAIVPAGNTYKLNLVSGVLARWFELRV